MAGNTLLATLAYLEDLSILILLSEISDSRKISSIFNNIEINIKISNISEMVHSSNGSGSRNSLTIGIKPNLVKLVRDSVLSQVSGDTTVRPSLK